MSEVTKISQKPENREAANEAAMLDGYVAGRENDLSIAAAVNPDNEAPQEGWNKFARGGDAAPPTGSPADNVVSMDGYRRGADR